MGVRCSVHSNFQCCFQLKAINLIRDVIDEVREAEQILQSSPRDSPDRSYVSERHRQQSELKLWVRLVEEGWCSALTSLLTRHSEDDQVVEVLSDGMASVRRIYIFE